MAEFQNPLNYIGNKKCIVHQILAAMPPHDTYIEPCMGSAEVFFRKIPVKLEILNDYNGDLVNFFRVMQDNDKMRKLLGRLALSVNSESIFKGNQAWLCSTPNILDDVKDTHNLLLRANDIDVDLAAAFLENQAYSFSSTGSTFGIATRDIVNRVPRLIAAMRRLQNATILHRDYRDAISYGARPGAFIFLDPPYKGTEKMYYKGCFNDASHRELFEFMKKEVDSKYHGECKFIITYNDHEAIRALAEEFGFFVHSESRKDNMRQASNAGCQYGELMIANYDMDEQAVENGYIINLFRQQNLFDYKSDYGI